MRREALNFLIPGFSKLAESYIIRPKGAPPKKKKPTPPVESDSEFDTIAKKACAEVFTELRQAQLGEKLARYSHIPKFQNPEGGQ